MSNPPSAEIILFPTRPAHVVWSGSFTPELFKQDAGGQDVVGTSVQAGADASRSVAVSANVDLPIGPDASAGVEAASDIAVAANVDADASHTQERLARALLALDRAITEQRTSVAAWRNALSDLSITMRSLSGSVQRYRSSLESLDAKVCGLRGEANRLERWADEAQTEATQRSPTAG
jgi:hypothetical protein